MSSSLRGTYPESTYGHVDGNISDKGYRCGLTSNNNYTYTSITGTRDPLEDFQNVTIVMPGDMEIVTWQMGKTRKVYLGHSYMVKKEIIMQKKTLTIRTLQS